MTRVLIAVDGTGTSIRAARAAHQLFGDGADYLAIMVGEEETPGVAGVAPGQWGVVWPLQPGMVSGGGIYPVEPATGQRMVETEAPEEGAQRVVEAAGLPDARPLGDVGDPVEAIVAAAENHDVDVIVVGHTDRSWFSRLFAPATATSVLAATDHPVLVVR